MGACGMRNTSLQRRGACHVQEATVKSDDLHGTTGAESAAKRRRARPRVWGRRLGDHGFNGRDGAAAIVIDAEGKILVAWASTQPWPRNYDVALARYNSDGSLDDGGPDDSTPGDRFGIHGDVLINVEGLSDYAAGVVVQADGKIVVAGSVHRNQWDWDFALVRLNSDGSMDDGGPDDSTPGDEFGDGGKVIVDLGERFERASGLAVQSDGKLVLVGQRTWGSGMAARFNSDGTLDDGGPGDSTPGDEFGTGGMVVLDLFGAIEVAVQSDGKLIAAGWSASGDSDFALVRLNTDGGFDDRSPDDATPADAFGTDGMVNAAFPVADMLIDARGRLVTTGCLRDDFATARYLLVPSPAEALQHLLDTIGGLDLLKSVESSLTSKLEAVGVILGHSAGTDRSIIAIVDAFMRGVDRWLERGKLTAEVHDLLLADAELLKVSVELELGL